MRRPAEIVIIAAIAENSRVIGRDGKLPWYIPEDLKRFKALTVGHPVIMGRKTFESILQRLGKPLPDRQNVVLTSKARFMKQPGVKTFASLQKALSALSDESVVFIIGGEQVFQETLRIADRLELTLVEGQYHGDAFFPEYEPLLNSRFEQVAHEAREGYRFQTYRRRDQIRQND